ncbi:Phosphotransferase enzyme family protein [Blastococcus aggregatus]|uniref:Phosphotransferase enzyme family protein n=1 Tax=Blastococcus aggregatus TaxID=38502 RepID=A0A285VC39_9ACTN|nr:phosphotransferase [Blastococcus aggregatus]SOC51649.1 Phosphotransferase enzyme family protein [Blastococcus aggregatus]
MPPPVLEPTAPPARRRAWPPALRLLLGERAGALCADALAPAGGRPTRLRATGTNLRPDGAATVRYAAEVTWDGGRRTRESLVATVGTAIPPGAALLDEVVDGTPVPVGLWRWPLDPALPALAWAARSPEAAARLRQLGLTDGPVRLRLRSYRPGRRAVVEATTGSGTLFLKVVRPSAVAGLVERHVLLDGAVPVPPVLGATDDGVVVLPGLAGTPMRELIAGDGAGLPGAAALDALLDALPAAAAGVTAVGRSRPGDAHGRAGDHAAVLSMVAPELAPRLDRLLALLGSAERGEHPEVPVHGDFYEAQLLVDDGSVVGLLDVDTVGRGHRIDDWSTLLGHLALLETILPAPATAARYRAELEEAALRRWPAGELRPRVAAVLLGLATGPFRVLQRDWRVRTDARITLAERWATAPSGGTGSRSGRATV